MNYANFVRRPRRVSEIQGHGIKVKYATHFIAKCSVRAATHHR